MGVNYLKMQLQKLSINVMHALEDFRILVFSQAIRHMWITL
jgi:hypothetical protein